MVGVRRGTVTTRFDRNIARSLKETIVNFEKAKRGVEEFSEDAYRDGLLEIPNTKILLTNKSTHGFPINCTFTDTKSIVSRVRDTKIHHNEAKEVKFALSVKVFPYPNNIFSVWVFLMSICDKQIIFKNHFVLRSTDAKALYSYTGLRGKLFFIVNCCITSTAFLSIINIAL